MAIEVVKVLRMKEGTGETSYAKTSYIQKQVLILTKSIKEEAIREYYFKEQLSKLCIADLGCSSAELNNLSVVFELIATIEQARQELANGPLEYQVCLNDLPGNDFNTVFKSLPSFEQKIKQQFGDDDLGYCFVNGVPGSFYGRLFPSNSLHFVHSSYSLMWLSKVPEGIDENKRNIYIARTSTDCVVKAYFEQYQKDFTKFLQCRSQEVIEGGRMVLTILGRTTNEAYSKESCYMWELLATVLDDMVNEGLIEEEKLNTFNIPQYNPSAKELEFLVKNEGSFTLDRVHISQVSWQSGNNNFHNRNSYEVFDQYDFSKCMRSVAEPLLNTHFGEEIIDQVFQRFHKIVPSSIEKNVFINVTVAMTKKRDDRKNRG